MLSSSKIGRFFGIDFYVHGTFWILPLLIVFSGFANGGLEAAAFDVAVVFALFGCVALHEVGHALAARSYGIRTRDITLYPIGGVASLEGMPRNPWHEIVVALAGPAVNLAIAAGLFLGLTAGSLAFPVKGASLAHDFMVQLFWINIGLLLFNLIPAFPMDGGRVFRALLSTRLGRLRATEIAARVATLIAILLGLQGLGLIHFLPFAPSVMLVVLAVVVYMLGQGELATVRQQEAARNGSRWATNPIHEEGSPENARYVGESFSGWTWDPVRRVWTEWRHGRPIRDVATL